MSRWDLGVARDQVDYAAGSPRLDFHARRASGCEGAAALLTAGTRATRMNRTVRTTVRRPVGFVMLILRVAGRELTSQCVRSDPSLVDSDITDLLLE